MRLAHGLWSTSSIAALICAAPACAQAAPGAAPAAQAAAPVTAGQPAAPDADSSATPDIVVTGSLIPRRDYSASSAIVTLDAKKLERNTQVTLEAVLNQLPQMGNGSNGTTEQNRTGVANINLRGLGVTRSLVLLDGRRLQPGDPSGAVDLNIIPTALINSVETITGGSSAAYGSDALAGVVNIRLQKHFSGILASGQVSAPEHGRGLEQDYNLALGDNFDDDRGNAFLAISYADRNEIQRKDRDFQRVSVLNSRIGRVIANLSSNAPSQAAVNSVFGTYGATPGAVSRTTAISFNDDGTLFTPSPAAGQSIVNYKGGFDDVTLLVDNALAYNQGYTYELLSPLTRYSAFGRVTHKVGDNITWYAEALFTNYKVSSGGAPPSIGTAGSTATVPVTNPFIPAAFKTLLASRASPLAAFPITYRFDQLGVSTVQSDHTTYQITTGLDGKIGIRDWAWSVYASRGDTREAEHTINRFSLSAVQALLNAPDGGASVCAGGLNLFGAQSSVSKACLDKIRYDTNNSYDINETMAQGSITGSLFKLPGGDLSFAVGGNWRHEEYAVNVDEAVAAGDIPGDLEGPSNSGKRSVTEEFGELLIPVLGDIPFIKKLQADIGFRHSNYTTSGGTNSYTANLTWDIDNYVSLRGGYSRAIRAPSLQDLFSSAIQAQLRIGAPSATGTGGDPCDVRTSFRLGANGAKLRDLCVALGVPSAAVDSFTSITQTVFGQTTGNPNLQDEFSNTFTAGIVLKSPFASPFLSGLRASADFYDIKIKNAIGQLPLATALAQCYNLDGVSNASYNPADASCAFFPRDPTTGQIEQLKVPLLNLAQYHTRGVDVQLDWQLDLDAIGLKHAGALTLNMVGTYLNSFSIQTISPGPTVDYAGYTQSPIDPNGRSSVLPRWKSVTTLSHDIGRLETTVTWRYIGPSKDVSLLSTPGSTTPGVRSFSYFDASFRYSLGHETSIRVGVNNVFDTQPPTIAGTIGNTDTETYDVIGRSFYFGVRTKF